MARTLICWMILMAALMLSFAGCGILRPDEVAKHPDAPMLILEGRGYVRVAIYDAAGNRLIEYGWIDLSQAAGWTLHKYDWERIIGSD